MTVRIHGTIEPLAYQVDVIEDECLFVADGVYDRYSGVYDDVWRYDREVYAHISIFCLTLILFAVRCLLFARRPSGSRFSPSLLLPLCFSVLG
ncbi:hypothetical protein DFH09DRAFT_1320137 [Mycena vulgaris]|nr:hypothetical protein DFH09DRAFT_1320137 [Mycena vulgaris]